ncbi:hypothetical protein EVAR_12886_1 [Eumeta japonica]|uniref:Uncharacterized protein n=1 Tax=Eumeta variegata TaxID=151549 RepID=A0A4C1TVR6_EUMVA|nr:hypothetical protein EVAR_12886_1 [Eumeta japonica]
MDRPRIGPRTACATSRLGRAASRNRSVRVASVRAVFICGPSSSNTSLSAAHASLLMTVVVHNPRQLLAVDRRDYARSALVSRRQVGTTPARRLSAGWKSGARSRSDSNRSAFRIRDPKTFFRRAGRGFTRALRRFDASVRVRHASVDESIPAVATRVSLDSVTVYP